MLTIIAAAIKKGDDVFMVPRPGRHDDVFALFKRHGITHRGVTQGFLNSEGRFCTRAEAARIAYDARQYLNQPTKLQDTLLSEDLW
jgi:hypothetical protein